MDVYVLVAVSGETIKEIVGVYADFEYAKERRTFLEANQKYEYTFRILTRNFYTQQKDK